MLSQPIVSRIKLPLGYELDVENFLLNGSFHDLRIIEHHWNSGDYYVQVEDLGHRLTFKFSGNVDITYSDYRPELIKEFDKILGEDQQDKRDWIIDMRFHD